MRGFGRDALIRIRWKMWVTIPVFGLTAACGLGIDDAERLSRAERFHGEGNYQAEIIELKNVLKNDPVNLEARVRLGEASLAAGDPASAAKEYRRAVELGADSKAIRLPYARALMETGAHRAVLEVAEIRDVDAPPTLARLGAARAEAWLALGRVPEARAEIQDATQADADLIEVRMAAAALAMAERRFPEAERLLDALQEDADDRAAYWERRALLDLMTGNPDRAVSSFERAITLASTLTFRVKAFMLQAGLVDALLAAGNTGRAKEVADAMLAAAPDHPLPSFLLARVAYQTGDMNTALSRIQAVIADQPRSAQANILAGAAALQLGQIAQAEAYFQTAVDLEPSNPAARKLLAQIRLQQGAAGDALDALIPAFESGIADSESLGLVGAASVQAGDPEQAIALYRQILARDAGNAEARLYLAAALMAAGRNAEAQRELSTVMGPDGVNGSRPGLLSVFGFIRDGDMAGARAAGDRLLDDQAVDAEALVVLGRLFTGAGNTADARRYLTGALQRDSGNTLALLALAETDRVDGQLLAARRRYTNVIIDDPENVAAYTGLAFIAEEEGSRAAAIEWLERARAADPTSAGPRLRLAELFLEQDDFASADVVLAELADIRPDDFRVANLQGIARAGRGRMAAAKESFGRAAVLAPEVPAPLFNLARAELALGNESAAIEALEAALVLDADHVNALLLLTELALGRNDLAAAEAALSRLDQLESEALPVRFLKADLDLARERSEAARQRYGALMEETGSLRAAYGVYRARRLENDPAALGDLESWIRRETASEEALLLLAQEQQREGVLADAVQTYQTIVEASPESATALNNLAWLYQETGDPRALAMAERAFRLAPESGAIADTLGWIHFKRDDPERALDYLNRAVQLAPDEPEIRYHLAVVYAAIEETSRARDQLELILASDRALALHDEAQSLLTSLQATEIKGRK